ncbi:MAG: transposase family protein, partial [Aggregatilineales bacterium]
MTLLSCLQQIPDPRSRHRREYPLHGLLAVLLLAAAHGENALRGMWLWGKAHAQQLLDQPLGLWGSARWPALGTFWYALQKL